MEEEDRRRYYCPADEDNGIRTVKLASWAASAMDEAATDGIASSINNVVALGAVIVGAMNAVLLAPEWARALVDQAKIDEARYAAAHPEMGGYTLDAGARSFIANFPMAIAHPAEA